MYKELCQQLVPAACVFMFEVTQVNTAPRSAIQNLPVKWFFSALLDAHSASPVSIAGMYFIIFSCRDLDGCPFFQKRYIERQAFQAFAFTWPPVSQRRGGWVVVANVTVKGNWQGGSFSEVFQACALFCHPLFHCWRATHVNGALLQDTVSWLTPSQLTGQKWLKWCSRCWMKDKKKPENVRHVNISL